MTRRSLPLVVTGVAASLAITGCEKELTISPPIDLSTVVEAQFDPTNPIPVLQLVPSPTALAEEQPTLPDGSANPNFPGLTVVPAPCTLPSTAQCLSFVDGWPTTTPITLFFSGEIDPASLASGVKLFERNGPLSLDLVPFNVDDVIIQNPRPLPPAACQNGGNGSDPETGYTDADIPPGIAVVIVPSRPLKPGTSYVLLVESDAEGGLRTAAGDPVQPSSLFSVLNLPEDEAPVTIDADGKAVVSNALLRSNLQGIVTTSLFGANAFYGDLTAEQRAQVDAGIEETARTGLVGLYGFFNQIITPLVGAQITSREKLVFANAWTTGDAPTTMLFDPLNQVFPAPNVELLTRSTGMNHGDVQVNLPILPPCPGDVPAPGCDTTTSSATKAGLNTLTGFSVSAPMTVPFSANIDPASLEGNVVMYPIDGQGMIDGPEVPLVLGTVDSSSAASALVTIVPQVPLDENTSYVVGIRKGIRDVNGGTVAVNSTYELLKTPAPLIDAGGQVLDAVRPALECSTVPTTGQLATPEQVAGNAQALEVLVQRERWQVAFRALEGAGTPISRNDLLVAWTHKTQDVTGALRAVVGGGGQPGLLDAWDATSRGAMPRLAGPLQTITGTAAINQFLMVADQFCVPLCQGGLLQGVPPNQCMGTNPAVVNHPLCQGVSSLVTGNLGEIRLYVASLFRVTQGNPFIAGTLNPRHFTSPMDPNYQAPELIQVPVWVVLPTGTSSMAPAAATIVQHGLGRAKEDGFFMANSLASAGQASILMDLVLHGARATDILNNSTGAPCLNIDPADVTCDPQTGMCMNGCDGVQDPSSTGIVSPNSFGVRDQGRQQIVDHLTLIRWLKAEGNAMGVLPEIDGTSLGYVGQSLGAITGANMIGYAGDDLRAAVLNVGGGPVAQIALQSPSIRPAFLGGVAAAGQCTLVNPANPGEGCIDDAVFRQFQLIFSWVGDPGDPVGNSIAVSQDVADKTLIQMAIPDTVVPNFSTIALGAAYGFNPMDNSSNSNFQTWDFSPGPTNCHGFLLAPGGGDPAGCGGNAVNIPVVGAVVGGICATYAAQAQAAGFIASDGMTVPDRTVDIPLVQQLVGSNCPTF